MTTSAVVPNRPRRLTARTLFSLPAACMAMLAVAIFVLARTHIAEPDIWWHMRNADYLLDHHSLPRVDMYSFSASGAPWLDYEWLSEVPYALAMRTFGLPGVVFVFLAVLWLLYGGLYYLACRVTDCKNAAIAMMLGIAFGVVSFGPRTLLFGWLCMVALLIVLQRFQSTGKSLWLLPPLFALWINLHGSWVFGMVVYVLAIASGLVQGEWGLVVAKRWSRTELTRLLSVLALSIAALFVNPSGYKVVIYPFSFILGHQSSISKIDEWWPVMFNEGNGKLVLGVLAAIFGLLLLSRKTWKLNEVLLTCFALWVALNHVRFLFFLGLILVPVLAPRAQLFGPYQPAKDKPWFNAAIIAGSLAVVVWFFPSAAQLQQWIGHSYPTAALRWMQQQHVNGRIFNAWRWGGYMEWNAPEIKPFIDTRGDIFVYNGTFDDYGDAVQMKRPLEVLNKYRIDYVLFDRGEPLSYLLAHTQGWHLIYSDDVASLYQRRSVEASADGPRPPPRDLPARPPD